jgi:hypothetical protein
MCNLEVEGVVLCCYVRSSACVSLCVCVRVCACVVVTNRFAWLPPRSERPSRTLKQTTENIVSIQP